MLPALLPAIRAEFAITITVGVAMLTTLHLAATGVQLLTGHLRRHESRCFFLPLGLLLTASISLTALVPKEGGFLFWLFLLVVLSGTGIGVVHPEGLRAIHRLDKIPATITSAVFMTGGFCGFCGGAWLATVIVSRWGLEGLYSLMGFGLLGIFLLWVLRIKLAAEEKVLNEDIKDNNSDKISFWHVFMITIPSMIAIALIINLLPTQLNKLGFELEFGGLSSAMLGFGGVAGSFFWGYLARHKGELKYTIFACFWGVPFLLAHLLLMEYRQAVWLLFGAGFGCSGAYPLMLTMARHSVGPTLGMRMALMVGGAGGIASLVLLSAGPVAEHFGVLAVLNYAWLGFVIAGVVGLWSMHRS